MLSFGRQASAASALQFAFSFRAVAAFEGIRVFSFLVTILSPTTASKWLKIGLHSLFAPAGHSLISSAPVVVS